MSKPRFVALEDSYRFIWEAEEVEMVMERFFEGSRSSPGLRCELTVETSRQPNPGLLVGPSIHNLMAPRTNASLAKDLLARVPGLDWVGLLTQATGIAIQHYREGGPLVDLSGVPEVGSRWLLPPLVSAYGPSVWAADGGTGKSVLALAVALSVSSGLAGLGYVPRMTGPVLYVDWEADAETHRERLQALWHGMGQIGEPPTGAVYYQHETSPLTQIAARLRRRVNETGAVLVVFDSLGQARGGGVNDDEATNQAFAAARTLKIPGLFIDHISKAQREGQVRKKTSIGSVYTRNNARILWVVEKAQEPGSDTITVAFSVDKYNFGRIPRSQGFRIQFANEGEGYDERLKSIFLDAATFSQIEAIVSPADHDAEFSSLASTAPEA